MGIGRERGSGCKGMKDELKRVSKQREREGE